MADTYDSSLPDDSVSSHSPRRPSSQRVPGTPRSAVPLPMLAAPPSPLARKNNLVLVLGFALLIAAGTVVLRLPLAATGEPLTWSEAFLRRPAPQP